MEDTERKKTTDEFLQQVQVAIDAHQRTPAQQGFVEYLLKEVPELGRRTFDASGIFFGFREVAHPTDTCRSLLVGEENLPKQVRRCYHGNSDFRFETASVRKAAYIDFCHPTIDEIWEDVRLCGILAAIAAVGAAILADNHEVAHIIFYPAFYSCLVKALGDRAREVEFATRTVTELGCWENHCSEEVAHPISHDPM